MLAPSLYTWVQLHRAWHAAWMIQGLSSGLPSSWPFSPWHRGRFDRQAAPSSLSFPNERCGYSLSLVSSVRRPDF
jgi:hypothetical protein